MGSCIGAVTSLGHFLVQFNYFLRLAEKEHAAKTAMASIEGVAHSGETVEDAFNMAVSSASFGRPNVTGEKTRGFHQEIKILFYLQREWSQKHNMPSTRKSSEERERYCSAGNCGLSGHWKNTCGIPMNEDLKMYSLVAHLG
jgi:hypothetical protein